jgi:hypothetical protein
MNCASSWSFTRRIHSRVALLWIASLFSFYDSLLFKFHPTHNCRKYLVAFFINSSQITNNNPKRILQPLRNAIPVYRLTAFLQITLSNNSHWNPIHPFVIYFTNIRLHLSLPSVIYQQIIPTKILGIHHFHPCYMSIPSNYLHWIPLIILDKDKTMESFVTNLFPRIWLLPVLQVNIFSAPPCYCDESLVSDHVGRSTAQSGPLEERCSRFPQSVVKQLHGHAMSELRKLSTLVLKVTDKFSRSTQQRCLFYSNTEELRWETGRPETGNRAKQAVAFIILLHWQQVICSSSKTSAMRQSCTRKQVVKSLDAVCLVPERVALTKLLPVPWDIASIVPNKDTRTNAFPNLQRFTVYDHSPRLLVWSGAFA